MHRRDVPMLRWSGGKDPQALRLLVPHDGRPGTGVRLPKGAKKALEQAKTGRVEVVSVKNDWVTVFADAP